jgi:hypothetical protein
MTGREAGVPAAVWTIEVVAAIAFQRMRTVGNQLDRFADEVDIDQRLERHQSGFVGGARRGVPMK